MARAEAIRKLKRAGYPVDRETLRTLNVLIAVTEDQARGLPHEHIVCGHHDELEIALTARAFFDALPRAARHHGLGFTDRYRYAIAKQSLYRADRFHGYLAKLARYLAKENGAEFLFKHHGQRVFYVAAWLSRISGLNMTVARLCRCVWAARHGYCDPPRIPARYLGTVERLMGPLLVAPNAP